MGYLYIYILGTLFAIYMMIGLPSGIILFVVSIFHKDPKIKGSLKKWSLMLIFVPLILFALTYVLPVVLHTYFPTVI